MTALATSFAGISRIDFLDWKSGKFCFISDKAFKLIKSPVVMLRSLRFPNRCCFANALEVFNGYCLASIFGFLNDAFCNTVIRIFLKSFLFS